MSVAISDADFYAPLKTSLLLTKGSGTPLFSRNSPATTFNNEGKLITLPSNAPRFYGARMVYNQIASSSIMATQTVTTTADAYTLSFKGTGTVTLSGTFSGSLVGTGATDRVQTTFTATAGTLTLTVSGSVTDAQLEMVTGRSDQTASEYINTSAYKHDILGTSGSNLSTSPWTYLNGAVTANVYVNPIDGLTNAGNFIPTVTNGQHYVTQNTTYSQLVNGTVAIVYAKLIGNIKKVTLQVVGGSNNLAHFDLEAVSTSKDSNVVSNKITSLGSGWFKLEAVWNSTITGSSFRIYASSGALGSSTTTEDGTSGIGLYLPSTGSADCIKHYATNKDGSAISDTALLGYHTNAFGRTNTLLWCRDLTNAVWVKTNVTAALTQTGIDGKANACSLITATANNATVLQTITLAATAASSSFYVKRSVGTGSISFTRDGGTNWTDITTQINSSTFTLIKIENTSVLNPVVGFKFGTLNDAIITDYGMNEPGTIVNMPILTTSASATRLADALSYQTSGNISDIAGTIIAKLNIGNWALATGSVVGDTTGLHLGTAGGGNVSAKDGTNTISTNITQANNSSRNIGMIWQGSTMKSFGNIDFGTAGSYDGSMNLTSIKIMSGAVGCIRDVGIWLTALADEDFKKVILTNPASYIKKNVHSTCTMVLNQAGTYFIDAAGILATISKKINTTSGSNIVTLSSGYDNVGLVVGGRVTNADLSLNTTVTAINGRSITLAANASFTRNNEPVTFEAQVATAPLINISSINFSVPPGSAIKMMRGGSLIFVLYNSDKFSLNELSSADTSGLGVSIEIPTNASLEIKFKKLGNWGNLNSSYGNI